jgi:N-acetylmuramoyl-L-alanine amidase
MVVIHYTAMDSCDGALKVLCNPDNEVSAHYVIAADGTSYQLVDEAQRAWHAGAGRWGDVSDVNSHSIGIELCNDGFSPFPNALMNSLETLLAGIMQCWAISPARVIGHSDLAPGRKIDPGRRFDWQRLARGGLALTAEPGALVPASRFRELAQMVGYSVDASDDVLLDAIRRRWRPWGEGSLGEADLKALTGVAAALGLDPYGPLA